MIGACGDGVATGTGRVVRVTPSSGAVTASTVPCPGAQDVVYVDVTVYATCMDDDVVIGLDADSLTEVVRIPVPGDPDALAAGAAGTLIVGLREGSAVVYVPRDQRQRRRPRGRGWGLTDHSANDLGHLDVVALDLVKKARLPVRDCFELGLSGRRRRPVPRQ